MTVKDIYTFLDGIAPFSSAENWDNVGLLVGNASAEVTTAVISLDCDCEAVKIACENKAQLIITHHPVIFDPVKALNTDSVAWKLAKESISVISAHTNLDVAENGVNQTLCDRLKINAAPCSCHPFLLVGEAAVPMNGDDFVYFVKEKLGCPAVRAYLGRGRVKKVAVCCGSGGDFLEAAHKSGADTLVTGDVKHSVFVEAARLGINLIDAGHYHTENIIVEPLTQTLRNAFPDIRFIGNHFEPFTVY